ncbi:MULTISPECIES: helix-turn-helix domain-containing protein [unclassified Rathayibacter]|uniref:helix-turn-helix domain-containing protein n=1 Tax=unclassified Rathayibacter TaxID=2609250 RepID=UPI001889D768|nr:MULTISPECIES: helix-turn-helix transcriptional regulator [unclassified Rathayibacter]MBF4463609.1 helix-turn-helix transcriptional regulator [Rathayibacter sp. VKM Ac-2879]MBF4504941.1 helix-turn-helix transcriptional regulator [Rathayibacter sp. VKM Ac-2878]
MFVITADQRDSRHDDDRVETAIARLLETTLEGFVLPPERTAGDEFQLVLDRADAVVSVVLALHRSTHWSIGLGIGAVERPLPPTTRAARGEAYFAARRAVEAAKGRPSRFSLDPDSPVGAFPAAADIQALADPLLHLRDARTEAGWQIVDLLESGLSQKEAAEHLDVSPQAVSLRVRAASARVDAPARDALARLLSVLDSTLDPVDERTSR